MMNAAFRRAALALSTAAALTSGASAQTREDGGVWAMWAGQGDLAEFGPSWSKVRWWFDAQSRFRDDGEELDTVLFRPALGYAINSRTTALFGYGWFHTDPASGDDVIEHRPWQQLMWNAPVEGFTLQSRSRLEQRIVEGEDDTGLRFREMLKVTIPVVESGKVFASAFDELFFDLNDTDWGQRDGFRQNRLFLGLGWFFGGERRHSVEIGYLHQWIDGAAFDRQNHILSINLFMNL